MQRIAVVLALLTCALTAAPASAQSPSGAGWTGVSSPEDVIAARQALMAELGRLMRPIDALVAAQPSDGAAARDAATALRPLLLALPHLFPPTTNLYDEKTEQPKTLALPAIWQEFAAFYALAGHTSAVATKMAALTDAQALRAAGTELRAACDACHAPYLRPYVASSVSEADLEFDFDSVLK
jgi:cytochrome c556